MQDKFGTVVAIKNFPIPELSFCHTTRGLRIEPFMNSSAVSAILTVVDSAVMEGKHRVIHMDNSALLQLKKGVRSKILQKT